MLEQGEVLRGRYKVLRRLGQGGMGAVYEAHDNVFDTSVALKEVTIDLSNALDTQAQEMTKLAFEREAKILAKVSHETIPHVKDYFIEKDAQFLIMELVDGDDLAKLLKQRNAPFPIGTIIEWTDQLLDALDYLHTQKPPIIHRDIKPQNLKLTTRKKIKLLDFGIAKGTESKSANTITNQTFVAATLNYSPIEQMVRVLDPTFLAVITHKYSDQIGSILEQTADARTDLYALGATVYHLVTNVQPAEAVKRGIEIWDGKPDPLRSPSELNQEIPPEFSRFLLKSMEINRVDRYNTAGEMRDALKKIGDVITKPTLRPTVEMSMVDLDLEKTQSDLPARDTDSPPPAPATPPPPQERTDPGAAQTGEVITRTPPPGAPRNEPRRFAPPPPNGPPGAPSSQPPQPEKKKRSKLLWLIPVAGLILVMFVGGALGVFLIYRNLSNRPVADANTNTGTELEQNTNTDTEIPSEPQNTDLTLGTNTEADDVETPEPTPAATTTPTRATSRPTPRPTVRATPRPTRATAPKTPRPTPRRTPVPRKTPKNMDCIFTDTCE